MIFTQLSHPTVFHNFIQTCISGFKDREDTTAAMYTDVLLLLKSVALAKSEEIPYFYPSPYTFQRKTYFKPD